MKRTQAYRMLAVVLGLVVLVLAGWSAEIAQGFPPLDNNAQDKMPGWKSYTDPDFGWSILYPEEWSSEIAFENPASMGEQVIRRRLALYGPDRATVWIDSSENRSSLSAESWFRTYKQLSLSSSPSDTVVLDATLDGQPAILAVDDKVRAATTQVAVVAVRGTIAIEITYLVLDGGTSRNVFRAILEGFSWAASEETNRLLQRVTRVPTLSEEILPSRPAAEDCCGISSPGNICICCTRDSDGKQVGNCVWWACHKRQDVPCAGNANTWDDPNGCAARAGKRIDATPEAGALAVFTTGNHIAYVESVSGDGKTINISEMSCYASRACGGNTGYNGVSYRPTTSSGKKYIHGNGPPPTPSPTCPTSGGVILYKHAGYDCGGEGEGRGWVRRDGTGQQNVGGDFNDQASSVRVPSGWSVKLFEHDNGVEVMEVGPAAPVTTTTSPAITSTTASA